MTRHEGGPFRIACFGTFDVENYGDLLFPLILERELRERLGPVELALFSPLGGNFPADPSIPIHAINTGAFEKASDRFDAFVIGGGDIISFRKEIAPVYTEAWSGSIGAHCACWALPLIHRPPHMPVLWNAPGVPFSPTPDQALLLRNLCSEVDYLSVRDEISRERLVQAGVSQEVHLVPDTALLIRKHYSKESLLPKARALLRPFGLRPEEVLVFQISPYALGGRAEQVARSLKRAGRRLGLRVLLLPIGYCHQDHRALWTVQAAAENTFVFLDRKLHPLEIAALIAGSACFAGSSLHGNITAFAYEVPHVIINTAQQSKLIGFARLIGRPELCITDWSKLEDTISRPLRADRSASRLESQVEAHFDRFAQIIRKGGMNSNHTQDRLHELRLHLLQQEVLHRELVAQAEKLNAIHDSKSWKTLQWLRRIKDALAGRK